MEHKGFLKFFLFSALFSYASGFEAVIFIKRCRLRATKRPFIGSFIRSKGIPCVLRFSIILLDMDGSLMLGSVASLTFKLTMWEISAFEYMILPHIVSFRTMLIAMDFFSRSRVRGFSSNKVSERLFGIDINANA